MMQVTPMWMPMTMPVVDVWLVASSFRQSHGGLRAGREAGWELWLSWSEAPKLWGFLIPQLLPASSPQTPCACLRDSSSNFLFCTSY